MTTLARIALSLALGVAIAALIWVATRHHVVFLPFILVLGAPLWWIWQPPQRPHNGK